MTKKEFINLFPIEAQITQEIINEAEVYDQRKCIGALTLASALPKEVRHVASWGAEDGAITLDFVHDNDRSVQIGTKEGINLMYVRKPQSITFIVL